MSLSAGTRLGPYEIVSPLGAGGMGEVYRARDTRLGREVAVKVLPQHLSASPEVRARFEREARTISGLSHPHICTLFDVGREGGADFLVMELIEGETLAARLQRGALPVAEVLRLGAQIAGALDRAHRAGVVHRDLKPGNVMLTRSGAKLMDFGLARETGLAGGQGISGGTMAALTQSPTMAQPLTSEGSIVGTFQYMSPEQLEGREADERSDLWAVGCVLYEMASGRRTFEGDSQASLIAAILKDQPRPIAELQPMTPPGLDWLVRRCLAKDPEDRWQNARDLAFQLEWIGEQGAVPAALPGAAAAPPVQEVTYRPLTFRRGYVMNARFLSDGQTVVYGAAWNGGPERIYLTRIESNDSVELALPPASLLGVSRQGELALSLRRVYRRGWLDTRGVLARAPLFGGAAREMVEDISEADWAPDGRSLAVIRRLGMENGIEFPIGQVLYSSTQLKSTPRVSPDGIQVAFIAHFSGMGHEIRVAGGDGRVRTLASLDCWPAGVCWSLEGNELWFGQWGGPEGSVISAVTLDGVRRVVARLPGTCVLHDRAASGDLLVEQMMLCFVTAVFEPGATRERDLTWFDMGLAKDISADGRTLLLDEQGTGVGAHAQVFLRTTDGAPPLHLGAGLGRGLSPDGRWACVKRGPDLVLLPTGAGQPREIQLPGIDVSYMTGWFPDGESLFVEGSEAGRPTRLYAVSLRGKAVRPITAEGVAMPPGASCRPLSPDGRRILALVNPGELTVHDTETGDQVGGCRIEPEEEPIRWHADGRDVFLWSPGVNPVRIQRVNVETGERRLWKELIPSDPTGIICTRFIVMTPDGETCAISYMRNQSQLHLVRGLR